MSDLDITGRVVFDASQAEGALDKIGDKADQMAREVQGAAAAAGKSVDKIGDGAAGSAEKFTRAEGRIADSIKRTQTGLELLGKTASQKLEFKINAQGLDPAKFEPALAKLRETEAAALRASTAASGSLNNIGISAGQTAAALRGVPAQFTDIVTSIQGGQAPLTVFLQQGGQLKDMFGGAGNAAKALGGYVVGLINPLTLAVGAVGALGYAAYKASEDAKALNKALILSNGATGASITDLNNYERALVKSGIASSTATAALVEFVGAGVKATAGLQEITKAAIDLERSGGAAVKDTAKAFAELAKDPLSSLQTLTLETYKQVQALSDQGDKLGAIAAAQQAYKESIELQTVALKAQEGPLDVAIRSWKSYGTAISEAGRSLATAVLGTPQTGNEQRAQLQQRRDTYAAQGYDTTKEDAQLAYFKRLDDAQKQSIANQQRDLELKNLLDKFNREDTAGKKQRELNQGITDYSKLLESGQISVTQYAAAIKKLSEAKEAGAKSQITDDTKGLNLYNDLLSKSVGFSADYAEKVGALSAAYAKGRIGLDDLKAAMKQLNSEQQINKDAAKAQEDQLKASAKAQDAYVKEQLKGIAAAEKSAQSAGATLQKYQDEEQALTLAAAKNISLAQAIAEVELARLREAQTTAIASNANQGVLLALDEEIKKREKIVQAIGSKESREAVDKSAKEAAADWKKAAGQIEQSITDALMRGFESGKGFGENLRDTLQNIFKTLVLRPIISAVVNPIAGQIASATGNGQDNFGGSNSPNFLSDFGGASAASYDKAGQWLINNSGTNQTLGDFGSSLVSNSKQLGEYTKVLGDSISYLEAASNFKDGSYGASIGQAAGTYFSGPLGGQIGKSIGEAVDKLFSPGEYVKSTGDASVGFDSVGNRTRTSTAAEIGGGRYEATLSAGADKLVGDLNAAYLSSVKALGVKASGTDFFYGGNNSDGGKFTLGAGVGGVGGVFNSGEQKLSDEAVKLAAARAVFAAVQNSDLPVYLSKVFDGITASTASQTDIDAALQYAGGLKQIRDALTETREPLQILKDTIDASFKSLGTSADTFKADFVAAIDAGISPDKLSQFVALGQNLDALAQSSGTAAEAVRSLTDIANERKNLQSELDRLTLSGSELLAKQRDALDESNRALFDQVQAAQSAKDAQQELAAATEASAQRVSDAISGLSNTRFELENQLLTLQGNTGKVATRTRSNDLSKLTDGITSQSEIDRITASYDYNLSLTAQIDALTASKAAAEENARAQAQAQDAANRAAESAANAANKLRDAWQSVTDSIFDEVRRIRGLTGADSAQSYAQAQANFSITAAQAKAGDQEAAKLLPELSKVLLSLAETQATSLLQLRVIQGQTAGALEAVGGSLASQYGLALPKLATGTNYIPQDGPYYLHEGESVVPVAYNPAASGGNNTDLIAEMQAMRQEIRDLKALQSKGNDSAKITADTLRRVTRDGDNMITKDYTVA